MKAISLFSGVGMFDLGVALAGYDIVAQVEIDDYCRKVLKRHAASYWPNSKQFTDVCSFGRHDITGRIDLIYGGFPCQPHSLAGSRKGGTDSRNLWPEFKRIISEFRPAAVLLENVPGITQAYTVEDELRPAYALTVIADLTELGYGASWGIISAADAGAPHQRDRWWCVAYANGIGRPKQGTRNPIHHKQRKHKAQGRKRANLIHEAVTGGETLAYAKHDGHTTAPQRGRYAASIQHRKNRTHSTRKFKRSGAPGTVPGKAMGYASSSGLQKQHLAKKPARQRYHTGKSHHPGRNGRIKSRMGGAAHGLTVRLDELRWPAGQNLPQYEWEAPRTVAPKEVAYRTQRVKALGNGGIWVIAYHLAEQIRERL